MPKPRKTPPLTPEQRADLTERLAEVVETQHQFWRVLSGLENAITEALNTKFTDLDASQDFGDTDLETILKGVRR